MKNLGIKSDEEIKREQRDQRKKKDQKKCITVEILRDNARYSIKKEKAQTRFSIKHSKYK
jgi:hypothetical protein